MVILLEKLQVSIGSDTEYGQGFAVWDGGGGGVISVGWEVEAEGQGGWMRWWAGVGAGEGHALLSSDPSDVILSDHPDVG